MQPISQTPYDMNDELLVCYSGHGLNNGPFDEQTVLNHLNTGLVRYSDPHCTAGISLLALRLLETSSYQTLTSLLTG